MHVNDGFLLAAFDNFFVENLKSLHDQADVNFLLLYVIRRLWQRSQISDRCRPLSHWISLGVKSQIVEFDEKDEYFSEFWDCKLIQHLRSFGSQ